MLTAAGRRGGQVLASLRVEQGRPHEALPFLRQSMALWYEQPPEGPKAVGETAAAASGPREVQELPSYEFRLETVKLLLELEDTINTAYHVCTARTSRLCCCSAAVCIH